MRSASTFLYVSFLYIFVCCICPYFLGPFFPCFLHFLSSSAFSSAKSLAAFFFETWMASSNSSPGIHWALVKATAECSVQYLFRCSLLLCTTCSIKGFSKLSHKRQIASQWTVFQTDDPGLCFLRATKRNQRLCKSVNCLYIVGLNVQRMDTSASDLFPALHPRVMHVAV